MTDADLAWLAGYLEGEGCFTIKQPTPKYPRYGSPSMSVSSTDEDIILRVARLVGKVSVRARRKTTAWKQVYVVSVQGPRAIDLMLRLLPHMGERRSARIREVIALSQRRPGIARGERAAHAKLTNAQVVEIRREAASNRSHGLQSRLARRYGVSQAAIWYLLKGRTFRSVPASPPNPAAYYADGEADGR